MVTVKSEKNMHLAGIFIYLLFKT